MDSDSRRFPLDRIPETGTGPKTPNLVPSSEIQTSCAACYERRRSRSAPFAPLWGGRFLFRTDGGRQRQATVYLQFQAPTQECSDQDQKPENQHILKRRFEYDGVDNVRSDQEIESDEQAPGYATLERPERRISVGTNTNNQSAQDRHHHRNPNHNNCEDLDPIRDCLGYLEVFDR
jgi:hypothetical protein